MFDKLIQEAAALVLHSDHAVALTGAGISTPSGIPDFRSSADGLWVQADPRVASLTGFTRAPAAFYAWVRPLARAILNAQPKM